MSRNIETSKHRNIEISKYRDNENNEKTMSYINIIKNGIVKENPTFVLMLGMCPTLATTTSAMNGMSMGLATMAVLICTNFVISCLKSITPDKVRIPVFIVVIAAFVARYRCSTWTLHPTDCGELCDSRSCGGFCC